MADWFGLQYGRITGRFVAVVADTTDAGENPDGFAMTGFITFTPNLTGPIRNMAATPPAITVPTPITVELDGAGDITNPGDPSKTTDGVVLLATDFGGVTGWTYRVSFQLQYMGQDIPIPSINISVPSGSDQDLVNLIPLGTDPSTGQPVLAGPQGAAGDQAPASFSSTSSGTLNLSSATTWGRSRTLRMRLTGNITSVLLPSLSSSISLTLTLVVQQDSSSTVRTIAWPAGVIKSYGVVPGPGTGAPDSYDIYHLFWDGTNWHLFQGEMGGTA